MESCDSCCAGDGRALGTDGRAQALVGPGLATPLLIDNFLASVDIKDFCMLLLLGLTLFYTQGVFV